MSPLEQQLIIARAAEVLLTDRLREIAGLAEQARLSINDIPPEPGRAFNAACAVTRGYCLAMAQIAMEGIPTNPPRSADDSQLADLH